MWKRIIAIILLLIVLTGCGDNNNNPPGRGYGPGNNPNCPFRK